MARKYLAGIKEILKCDICLDDMKKPLMLDCFHSFCESCLCSMDCEGSGRTKKLECPKCRRKTELPWGGARQLPTHWKLAELAELFSQPEEEPVCVACPGWMNKNKPEYFCPSCEDYLCEPCANGHMDTPLFEDHEVVSVGEHEFNRTHCPDHPYKYKDYYCEDCKVLVCSACITAHHKDHRVSFFEGYDEPYRTQMESQKKKLTEKYHLPLTFTPRFYYYSITEPNECIKYELKRTKEAIEGKIKSASLSVINEVEMKRDELLKQLEENHAILNKTLSADDFGKECEALLNHKSPGYLLDKYQKLSQKLESFLAEEEEMPDWMGDKPIVYYNFIQEKSLISIGSLGVATVQEFRRKCDWRYHHLSPFYF